MAGNVRWTTGATGASGRTILIKEKKCELFGRRDFCCDPACRYLECGIECGMVNMKSYPGEFDPIECEEEIEGYGYFAGYKYFCCP